MGEPIFFSFDIKRLEKSFSSIEKLLMDPQTLFDTIQEEKKTILEIKTAVVFQLFSKFTSYK